MRIVGAGSAIPQNSASNAEVESRLGLGGGWSTPIAQGERTQGLIESYYRLQVTGSLTLSFDLQVLLPPASDALPGAVVAGALRAKFAF